MKTKTTNSTKTKFYLLISLIGISLYYLVAYNVFIKETSFELPSLRARLGTILWHTSDRGSPLDIREEHFYCYYPKTTAVFDFKAGEYIIKRVSGVEDCQDWLGIAIFIEDHDNSERDKIWWDT